MTVKLEVQGDIAVVIMDFPPVNAIGQETRQGLLDTFIDLKSRSDITRVILTGAGRAFAAGADAREFDKPTLEPHLPDVVIAIEQCGKPTIAVIDGPALGGGYELALACKYRVASPKSIVGLPEVNLGIVPGSGGTQRLPRLIGVGKSVALIADGRSVKAAEALAIGMIDAVEEKPMDHAMALDLTPLDSVDALSSIARSEPDDEAVEQARVTARKRKRGQIAPEQAINLVEASAKMDFDDAIAYEREIFLKLRESEQASALRHIFFAERGAKVPAHMKDVQSVDITTAVVVGGGTMGASIAYALQGAGINVCIIETDEAARDRAQANVSKLFDDAVDRGLMNKASADEKRQNITFNIGYDDLPKAELAIEAAFEDMAVKKEIFAKLSASLPSDSILSTNTSYLDINEIADAVSSPEQVLGLHFFSPAHIMKLFEIVQADRTCDVALATAFQLAKRLRKIPVLAGVCDGFIGNRILARYREVADITMIYGATPWEIDAAMVAFGYPMGPYMAQDLSGLDIAYANRKRQAPQRDPERYYVKIGDRLVEDGRLGRKTGSGWYQYQDGAPQADDVVEKLIEAEANDAGIQRRSFAHHEISERLVIAMINEAFNILDEGIAARPADIDLVLVHGYGFPRWRGGLMFEAYSRGLKDVLSMIELYAKEDPTLWAPSPLLQKLVSDGTNLYDWTGPKFQN